MMRTAIIQLGRLGDIISILPVAKALSDAGNRPTFFTHPEFASILTGITYADYQPHGTSSRDVGGATQAAKDLGFVRIIVTQREGEPKPPYDADNFITAQWARAGFLSQFHALPLVFDSRDKLSETAAISKYLPAGRKRPILAFCFRGHSSPYRQAENQCQWLINAFGASHTLLDLAPIWLNAPHNLLGLLERADCLLTVDTMHLHLAYAVGTPTLALSPGYDRYLNPCTYYDSEPRAHWVHHCTYADSIRLETREEIKRIITERDYAPGRLCRTRT